MLWVHKTDNGNFRGNLLSTFNYSGTSLTGTIGSSIYGMESYGVSTAQQNYFFGNTSIKKTNYLGTTLVSTISTNYVAGAVSAI